MDLGDSPAAHPRGSTGPTGPTGPLGALAGRLRALPPSCGPVRLVGVDGHAGSGKSTFAERLAETLGGAPVVHLDDFASHDELFCWTDRFRELALAPLRRGERASYGPYDWVRRRFAEEPGERITVPPAPVVIVEGVGAGRRALRPYLARLLWMELADRASWERGQHRDGPDMSTFWDSWLPAEREHFAADPSRPYAELLVLQGEEGYEVLPGPVVAT
ncbi:uridine kinase family protein [Streptomyces sp. H27-D2]|uniref:uridine kinase family protein n=1 Tax=Streptomyces sp. H27-D2 TaxID=3046304 RepID=UPI002DBE565D|nr:hypothetical protein [Streptomyces sp. H27-D2]MEC4015501.1 hypothetical protein [Streptomyces sp. H27-D2]